MIDVENIVFNNVEAAVRDAFLADYPQLTCYSEYVAAPSGIPSFSLYESNNRTYRRTLDERTSENHARITYMVDVYTNNEDKKTLARQIANVIDMSMQSMNFQRVTMLPTPNMDRSIYRITMRYEGLVERGKTTVDSQGNEHTEYLMHRE